MFDSLQVANEMLARGIFLRPVDLYRSDARKFLVEEGQIRLPFSPCLGWESPPPSPCRRPGRPGASTSP